MIALAPLLALWQDALIQFGLVFLRMGAVMALLPAFGEQSVPLRVRLGLTLAFTAILAPAVAGHFPAPESILEALAPLAGVELLAGLAVGIAIRLSVVALQIAGTIAANATSLSQAFGGMAGEPQPAIGHVLVMGGLALATMAGLHEKVVAAMIYSYDLFPPGQAISPENLAQWGGARISGAFGLAFTLAAPFVIASLLYNLALGVINKAMPQLMVAMVGAPAITLGGMALTAIAMPYLLSLWLGSLDAGLADLAGP